MTKAPEHWTTRRFKRAPVDQRDNYRPIEVVIRPKYSGTPVAESPNGDGPPGVPTAHADVVLHLHHHLRGAGHWAHAVQLFSLCLAYGKSARSVYVRGGSLDIRYGVAHVLATAYEPTTQVDWDDPDLPGVRPAPLRLAPTGSRTRPGRPRRGTDG